MDAATAVAAALLGCKPRHYSSPRFRFDSAFLQFKLMDRIDRRSTTENPNRSHRHKGRESTPNTPPPGSRPFFRGPRVEERRFSLFPPILLSFPPSLLISSLSSGWIMVIQFPVRLSLSRRMGKRSIRLFWRRIASANHAQTGPVLHRAHH